MPEDAVNISGKTEIGHIDTWIFDLDNTLYPASSRLFDQIDKNMTRYIMRTLDLDWDDAYKLQKTFFRSHGTTMRGLMSEYGVDPADFLKFVHDIDLSSIPANPALDEALGRLPGRKVIFTNGSTDHAANITGHLGIERHFDATFDIVDGDYRPKPDPDVYHKFTGDLGIDPTRAMMFEDMARNLVPAAAMGMTTVWVRTDAEWGVEGSEGGHVHHVADDLARWLGVLVGE